jgi:hypothetical protein
LKGRHRLFNINQSFDDVRKYLIDEFGRIRQENQETMATVPCPWPACEVVEELVRKSSGYFIYASTVIKYIDDKSFRPTDRLEVILGITEPDSGSPFGPLDQLYTQVLSDAPARPQLLSILTVIASDLGVRRVYLVEQLLELRPGDVRMALRRLSSVMHISVGSPHFRPSCPAGVRIRSAIAGTDSSDLSHSSHDDGQITPHHASFLDFLRDPTRAGIFHVDGSSQQIDLACHIVKAVSHMELWQSFNGHVVW